MKNEQLRKMGREKDGEKKKKERKKGLGSPRIVLTPVTQIPVRR